MRQFIPYMAQLLRVQVRRCRTCPGGAAGSAVVPLIDVDGGVGGVVSPFVAYSWDFSSHGFRLFFMCSHDLFSLVEVSFVVIWMSSALRGTPRGCGHRAASSAIHCSVFSRTQPTMGSRDDEYDYLFKGRFSAGCFSRIINRSQSQTS